jgi:hypothetical protein
VKPCLRKAIDELAAGRPREAHAMVANAAGSVAALREMVDRQILKQVRDDAVKDNEFEALDCRPACRIAAIAVSILEFSTVGSLVC